MNLTASDNSYQLDPLQRAAMTMMAALTLLTFVGTNMQALLWQSSDWLVSTVLPAVVVDLTNDERADVAAVPLQRNSTLDAAAASKAQHMAENEYFAHFAPDGTTPWSFFKSSGYVYAHAGENLAIHFTDSTEVVEAWMQSPAHQKNIVDTKYTEIGVGTAKGTYDGYDTVYVVQLFGTPAIPAVVPVTTPVELLVSPQPVTSITDFASIQAELDEIAVAVATLSEQTSVSADPVAITLGSETTEVPLVTEVIDQPEAELTPEPDSVLGISGDDTIVISSELATSSGLAVATLIEPVSAHAGATIAAVATQPNVLLDIVYTGIVGIIILLLLIALIGEVKRFHVVQVAYSVALLLAIGGLWYVHTLLTSGAVIA
jgi:uncharacterized protein YkwD